MSSEAKLSDSEDKQRSYYDSIADIYDEHYASEHNLAYRRHVLDSVFADRPVDGLRVLDALCGGGQNGVYFAEHGCQVTGIDISSKQCEHYSRRLPGCEVHCRSILDTGLDDESFDLVFTDSLHHLHPYVNDAVRELTRVLVPGGRLVVWEPSAGSLLDHARKLWYRLDRSYFEDNEASIDIRRLAETHRSQLRLDRQIYGGNVAYLLVGLSMPLRIPLRWVDRYKDLAMRVEDRISGLQGRRTSLWALAVFEKRADEVR